ncbi:MAG: TIGR01244 family sulfur transferase [Pelagimonas sp.]|jgi:uncharacterized protein (TIGR01244 family)|nr:TIGR01244 family sulfur transferase [Pelagimonas sp.]
MKKLTDTYYVAGQISASDVPSIAEAGIKTIICNRPDAEVPPSHRADVIAQAAQEAGLTFEVLPITHQSMTAENVQAQMALLAQAGGPVLAYCASGTRCTVLWALGHVADNGVDAVLDQAAQAGYDLAGMRPLLASMA